MESLLRELDIFILVCIEKEKKSNLYLKKILKNTENIPPQVIKKVLKEINELTSEPLDGIRLIPNEQDICDIQAYIDGPGDLCMSI